MSKNKKSNQFKASREFIHAKITLLKSENPLIALSKIRTSIPSNLFYDIIRWIQSNDKINHKVFSKAFPASISELRNNKLIPQPTAKDKEVKWTGTYLSLHAEKIMQFISLSSNFQNAILTNNEDKCEELLQAIEKALGHSLWLIKNKIAFLQLYRGLEAQKLYTKNIREEAEDAVVDFLTYWISYRNEKSVSTASLFSGFENIIQQSRVDKGFSSYLSYHTLFITPQFMLSVNESHIAEILRYESVSAVIDHYETFLAMSRLVIAKNYTSLFKSFSSALSQVYKACHDPRIPVLLLEMGLKAEELPVSITSVSVNAFSECLKGNYEEALNTTLDILKDEPDSNLLEIAARALSILHRTLENEKYGFVFNLLSLMSSIITKDEQTRNSLNELVKIIIIFSSHDWANNLLAFIVKEISSDPLKEGESLISFGLLASPIIHPLHINYSPDRHFNIVLSEFFKKTYPDNVVQNYCTAAVEKICKEENLKGLSLDERLLLKGELNLQLKQFEDALGLAKELMKSSLNYYRHKAIRIIAHCQIKLLKIQENIEFITTVYMNEKDLHYILPIKETIEEIDDAIRNKCSSLISLPILYDMHVRYVDRYKESLRSYAYEDFLLANKIRRPSELKSQVEKFDKEKLIYYLRYICTENIMANSIEFDDSKDVANERLTICQFLAELDTKNAEIYQAEFKNILGKLTIKKRLREVNQSKIYVNVIGFKEKATETLKENFDRYISFLENGFDNESMNLIQAVRALEKSDINKLLTISLPKNEFNDLLESIIVNLRDQFVSSTEHGLDGYLSVRIRHGTLSGQLRRPLEITNLITQKDSVTNEYKDNTYWIKKLNINNTGTSDRILTAFSNFSKKYDELIQLIITDWIQVKKTPADKGLFNFSLVKGHITLLTSALTEKTTFEQFLDLTLNQIFIPMLKFSLKNVRNKISTEAKHNANVLITGLQTEIDQLLPFNDIAEFSLAIGRARTEVMVAFDRIEEWFYLSNSAENEPFSIEEIISLSEAAIKMSSNNFKVEKITISEDLKETKLLGHFPDYFYILLNIFENIVRHSGLENPSAFIKVDYRDNLLTFFVENDLGVEVKVEDANTKIQEIKNAITRDLHLKSVTKEGGTGFYKIKKILTHDFKISSGTINPINFGFRDGRFFVEIRIPIKEHKQ